MKYINEYKNIELKTRVESASPHELINLLIQGAKNHIAKAQGNLARQEIIQKGENIGKALSIVEGLKISLDHEKGGEIAQNLLQFYSAIEVMLLKANLKNDADLLNKANHLLCQVHEAWQSIALEKEMSSSD